MMITENAVNRKLLRMIVVYHHAKDHPEHNFVARQYFLAGGKWWAQMVLFATGASLREVRGAIPPYMVCVPAMPGEDPAIVESWI